MSGVIAGWIIGTVFVGNIPPAVFFSTVKDANERLDADKVRIHGAIFTIIWIINYAGFGYTLYRMSLLDDPTVPMTVIVASVIQSYSFYFTNSLRMTAYIDAMGILMGAMTAIVVSKFDLLGLYGLIPWLAWMPLTFAIKIAAINGRAYPWIGPNGKLPTPVEGGDVIVIPEEAGKE